jgi:hypothetical protein
VFSDGTCKITSDGGAAEEELYLAAREQRDMMDKVGSIAQFTCCEVVCVDVQLCREGEVCVGNFVVLMSFDVENFGFRWVCSEELESLEDDVVFRLEHGAFDWGQPVFGEV